MNEKTKSIVGTGILTAIVIVLQALAIPIKLGPFSVTLVLIPIVVGAALYGYKAGAWLGFVFGVVVLITDSAAFLAVSVPGTVATVILKGVLAGLVAGLVYRALEKKSRIAAVIGAAVVCPVVNTGVFLLGCIVFFFDTVKEWGIANDFDNVWAYMFFGLVGLNFIAELAANIILNPIIIRILNIIKKPAKS